MTLMLSELLLHSLEVRTEHCRARKMPDKPSISLVADMIALGAIFAVAGCGGPLIPFSAGRVDTTVAGPATVPEPQQDLASHIESFRRQGFNETEMIALVACGHTLGGVRQVDFPLTVTDTSIDVDTFDTTPAFDNAM